MKKIPTPEHRDFDSIDDHFDVVKDALTTHGERLPALLAAFNQINSGSPGAEPPTPSSIKEIGSIL